MEKMTLGVLSHLFLIVIRRRVTHDNVTCRYLSSGGIDNLKHATFIPSLYNVLSMISCQKGPTRHAYAWDSWDTLDVC